MRHVTTARVPSQKTIVVLDKHLKMVLVDLGGDGDGGGGGEGAERQQRSSPLSVQVCSDSPTTQRGQRVAAIQQ